MKIIYFLIFTLFLGLFASDTDSDTEIEDKTASEIVINIPESRLPFVENKFSQVAILAYLQMNNLQFAQALNSHFTNRLEEAMRSPQQDKQHAVALFSRLTDLPEQDDESKAWRELHKMIVEATQEVYLEQNKEIYAMKKNMNRRWTKKRAAILTSACTLLGVAVSAAISYFTSKTQC